MLGDRSSPRPSPAMMRRLGRAIAPLFPPRAPSSTRRAASSTTAVAAEASSTMQSAAYALHSPNQYAAHRLTRDPLAGSLARLARRCKLEDVSAILDGQPLRRRRLADLGSADGSSSMETLQFAVRCLRDESASLGATHPPLHVTFEEHPASDEARLRATINLHDDWLARNDVTWDVKMQSFYEPLFAPQSMDFMMSYLCLHWLDGADVSEGGDIAEWKRLGAEEKPQPNLEWTFINERTAPKRVWEAWRTELAHRHLAKFLSLRAREMRPGAELLLVMVGHPHEFVVPSDGGPSPLSRAMKACIQRGEVREEIFHRTVVPYFQRTADDIPAALAMARTLDIAPLISSEGEERPGAFLELVDCQTLPAITKGEDDNLLEGAFELFWSIHLHSIKRARPSNEELQCLKRETRRAFAEIYDDEVGIPSTFVACTLRRRTRERAAHIA
ncbi:hypothetical protein ACHAXT_005980 [Thalassiosira profunda]